MCGATWQVLPMFIARQLWRSWRVVERAIAPASSTPLPPATVARWRQRLGLSARVLIALLTTATQAVLDAVAALVGLDATRAALVEAYAQRARTVSGERIADLATLIHRLQPGVRLM